MQRTYPAWRSTISGRYQAMSQVCAFPSLLHGSVSEIEMFCQMMDGIEWDTGKGRLNMPSSDASTGRHESRRSTRVRMKVQIEAKGFAEPLTCEGETIVVSLHGALILTTVALRVGMRIELHVILTDKRALADVIYVDPDHPKNCGIGLVTPNNIWGVTIPPDDWADGDHV